MNEYKVTTPDGEVISRKSAHEYTHVVFFKFSNMNEWGVNFCASEKLAKSKVSYYNNCPGVVKHGLKVETVIEEIHDWWKACEICGKFYCVGHEETRATSADVSRMWARLWGETSEPVIPSDWARMEDGELLDLTQKG